MIHHYNLPKAKNTIKLMSDYHMVYLTNTEFDDTGRMLGLHNHEDVVEIAYIYQGRGRHIINEKEFLSEAGDIVVYNQGVMHHDFAREGETMRVFLCSVANLQLAGRKPGYLTASNNHCVFSSGHYSEYILRGFEAVEDALVSKSETVPILAYGFLMSLLAVIEDLSGATDESMPMVIGESLSEQMKNYINNNYANVFSLKDLADEFHVSRYYASHVFTKAYGESPIRYRTKLRMGEAQSLLANTNNSISYIANAVGYDDPNRFSQVFSKEFGFSPTQYRKTTLNRGLM